MMLSKFKPNLIPNNPKGVDVDQLIVEAINKNGSILDYRITLKKDGCRMQFGLGSSILSRSLKPIKSDCVNRRFSKFNQFCLDNSMVLDAEFYMHGLKFNEIFRFFSNQDITRSSVADKYIKLQKKDPKAFEIEFDGRDVEFLTTFHSGLKAYVFDGILIDRPDLVGYEERMIEINQRLDKIFCEECSVVFEDIILVESNDELFELYEDSLQDSWEGLVLTHKDHKYKFGRNSISQGTLLKMKDDANEYDGIVVGIEEGSIVDQSVERTVNELGRSVTSKKKDDRNQSGKAKGIVCHFENLGTFTVGLKGFNDEQKKELLENQENYIGKHFKYTAMNPVKNFPRHAYFSCWRDEK